MIGTGANALTVKADAKIVLQGVSITAGADASAVSIESGNVTLIVDGGNTLTGGNNGAGIYVAENASLTIQDTDAADDKLTAIGNAGVDDADGAAGIGGTWANGNSGAITIDGATVVAKGYGVHGSGIGSGSGKVVGEIKIIGGANVTAYGGYYADGAGTKLQSDYGKTDPEGGAAIGGGGKTASTIADITITDATVVAYGGSKAAGIGANFWSSVDTITISGNSNVTAQGGSSSAGIGTGRAGDSGVSANIVISGGTVNATGGAYGAGIGGGYNANSLGSGADASALPETTITISGGNVTATGGEGSAGIGGGYKTDNVNVDITGGTVTATAGALVSGKTAEDGVAAAIGTGANGSGTFENCPAVEIGTAAKVTVNTYDGGKAAIEGLESLPSNVTVNSVAYGTVASIGDTNYETLAVAVAEAKANDVILLYADVNADVNSMPSINKPLTIKGGFAGVAVNCAIAENFPDVDGTVAFENLTFNNRISTENASNDQSKMTLKFVNCTFNVPAGNTYAIQAGASWNNDVLGALVVENCTFNTAATSFVKGYMIYAQCVENVTVIGNTMDGNDAFRGAIHLGDSTKYATIAKVQNNTIKNFARGVQVGNRVAASSVTIDGNDISVDAINGEAESAALYIHEVAQATATDVVVTNNDFVSEVAPVVFSENATGDISDFVSKFENNTLNGEPIGAEDERAYEDTVYVAPAAQVGTEKYETLADAITAANASEGGATVTLLSKVTLGEKLTISGNVTISGEYTITRDDAYTGTLFAVNAGATLTLDGGLVIDGGNEWVMDADLYKTDLWAFEPVSDGTKYFTPELGAPVATAHMITVSGTDSVVNLNKVTIKNHYATSEKVIVSAGTGATVNLNGATITHNAITAGSGLVVNASSGKWDTTPVIWVNMNEGTVIDGNHVGGNHGVFKIYMGTAFTMNGGSIKNTTGWNSNGVAIGMYWATVTMNGGEICSNSSVYGPNNGRNAAVYVHNSASFTMNDGIICHNAAALRGSVDSPKSNSTTVINGGSIINNYSVAGSANADVFGIDTTTITGGTFTQDVSAWLALDTGLVYDETTGTYSVTKDLAEVNGAVYTSIAAAIEAANAGDTVKVLASHKLSATVVIDKNIVLDLNGKTITSTGDVFEVVEGGTLTINGDGEVKGGTSGVGSWCAVWANGGNVVINGGTYSVGGDSEATDTTHQNDVIYTKNGGTVVINGGTFLNDGTVWTLNQNDATGGDITVKGGTFYGWDPANNVSEGEGTNFCASNYKTSPSTVDEVVVYTVVAANSFNIYNVEDLYEFAALANAGDTFEGKVVNLMADIDLAGYDWTPIGGHDAAVAFAGEFNGNGHTISNLTINKGDVGDAKMRLGLFASPEWGANIHDFTLKNVYINATGSNVRAGAIAGNIWYPDDEEGTANITNVTIDGFKFEGTASYLGGIAGYFVGGYGKSVQLTNVALKNIDFTNNLNAKMYIGGITGAGGVNVVDKLTIDGLKINVTSDYVADDNWTNKTQIGGVIGFSTQSNPYTIQNTTITGLDITLNGAMTADVGGLVAQTWSSSVMKNSSVSGKITNNATGKRTNLGGVIGRHTGRGFDINNVTADVDIISSVGYVGGFIGFVNDNGFAALSFTDCEAKGDVSGEYAGGFAGYVTEGTYTNCVAAQDPFFAHVKDDCTLVNDGSYVASVGNAYYAKFDNALAAAKAGDVTTVVLLAPVVITADTTLDLTGLTVDGNGVYPAFRIQDGANVTVKGGTVTNSDYVFVLGASDSSSAGNLTIESGSYTGETTVASVTKGTLTILGGEFKATDAGYGLGYTLNCIDANYRDGSASIVVKGGTFHGFNPADNTAEGANTDFVPWGYKATQDDDVYTVAPADEFIIMDPDDMLAFAAMVNGGNKFAGKVVKLGADIDLAGIAWAPIGGDSVYFAGEFDGQGYTIKNLTQTTGARMGLFGLVEKAYIHDFTMENVNLEVNANNARVGAIAGNLQYWNVVENVTIDGITITANGNDGLIGSVAGYVWKSQMGNVDVKNAKITINGSGNVFGGNTGYGRAHVWDTGVTGNNANWLDNSVQTINGTEYVLQNYWVDCDVDDITITINGNGSEVGGFFGSDTYNSHSNYFVDCHVTDLEVNVAEGTSQIVGGFIAWNNGTTAAGTVRGFDGCTVSGTINGANGTYGGFAGQVGGRACEYYNATADVDITSTGIAGGFVGITQQYFTHLYTFTDCVATGDVKGTVAGGFAGKNALGGDGDNINVGYYGCSASGKVNATSIAGGFIGEVNTELPATNWSIVEGMGNLTLNSNVASEDVTGDTVVGYLIGYLDGVANGDAKEGNTLKLNLSGNQPDGSNVGTGTGHHINISGDTIVNDIGVFVASVTSADGNVTYYGKLEDAIADAVAGDTVTLLTDVEYATTNANDVLTIEKAITLDLGGYTLTTTNGWGGMKLKGGCSLTNGTLKHTGNTAAIKAWNVESIENVVIDVATYTEGKVKGGIVIQENATGIDTIKNVIIKGEGLTNGIETYNCGNATSPVIGSMENVTIDAKGTGMLISAPCGTATNCNIKGGVSGIEIWIKGTYSAILDLKGCTVEGGEQPIYAHDEFSGNPDIVNNGTLRLTIDDTTQLVNANGIVMKLTIARAENVDLNNVIDRAVVEMGDVYYATIKDALGTLKSADTTTHTVTVLMDHEIDVNYSAYNYPILVNGFSIELDLNGKTITADWSKYVGDRKDNALIGVCNGGKLTVTDSVGGGKIVNNDNRADVENRIFWIMNGTATKELIVNIEGGTFVQNEVNTALLYVQGNKPSDNLAPVYINITGGHFETVNDDFFNAYDGFQHESYIYGGTFNKNPTDWEIKIHPSCYLELGADGIYAVKPGAVANINNVGYATFADAYAAAQDGDTITLLTNVTEAGVKIDKSITIDFQGFTYTFTSGVGSTGTSTNGFQILKNNTVVLKDGKLTVAEADAAKFYILIQNYADLTVSGMTLDGTNLDKYAFTDGDSYVLSNNNGNIVIENTTITANNDGDKAFAFDVCDSASYAGAPIVTMKDACVINGNIEITGASKLFAAEGLTNITTPDADYKVVYENGAYIVVAKVYVAEVNGVKYESVQEAVDAANAGDTVTLLKSVTVTDTVIIDKDITLDLNGQTISADETVSAKPVIRVLADVTVKNGTVDGRNGTSCYAFIVGNNTTEGNLTIVDGHYYGGTTVASVTKGTLTIEGGYFEATPYNGAYEYTLNCIDANYDDGSASIVVKGGTFYGFNPENNAAEGKNTNFVVDYYESIDNGDGTYTVRAMTLATVEAEIIPGVWGSSNITIENWADLVAALGENTNVPVKVTLMNDIALTETLIVAGTSEKTIDLNGNTLKNEIPATATIFHTIVNNGTLTVIDSVGGGSIESNANNGYVIYTEGGDLTVDGAKIVGINKGYALVTWTNGDTITIEDGTVVEGRGALYVDGGATATVNGGTFTMTVQTDHNQDNVVYVGGTSELTINGGTFSTGDITGAQRIAIAALNTSKVTINGGTFYGLTGDIQSKNSASVSVSDGTFTGTKLDHRAGTISLTGGTYAYDPTTWVAEGFKAVDNGDGTWTVKPLITVTFDDITMVNGNELPKFTHTTNFGEVSEDGMMLVVENPEVTVNGAGEYEITANAYVFMSDDYAVEVVSGKLTVLAGVAKITNTHYASLADAVAEAVDGDKIELLSDITVTQTTIRGDRPAIKITIDLGGHTITSSDVAVAAFRDGTEVTFTNGTVSGNSTGGTLKATYGGTIILGDNITVVSGGQANAIYLDGGKLIVGDAENVVVTGGIGCLTTKDDTANIIEIASGNYTGAITINDVSTCTLTGGTFTMDVNEWCADGYYARKNGDGTWTVVENVKLQGSNVILGDYMGIGFFYNMADLPGTGYYAEIYHDVNDDGTPIITTVAQGDWAENGTYYQIKYIQLAAKQMSDIVSIRICDAYGTVVSAWNSTQSIAAVAVRHMNQVEANAAQLSRALTDTEKLLLTAYVDLLNYGTVAQNYFNYKTDAEMLANYGVTDAQQTNYATAGGAFDDDGNKLYQTVDDLNAVNALGTNLVLEANLQLKMYFRVVDGTTLDDLTIRVAYGNVDREVTSEDIELSGTMLVVNVDTIPLTSAAVPVTVTVTDSIGEVVASLTYSINDAAYSGLASHADMTEEYTAVLKLCKSLGEYFN